MTSRAAAARLAARYVASRVDKSSRGSAPRSKRIAKEEIPGGLAEGKSPKDFDPKQLAMGTKVEREHLVNNGYSEAELKAKAQEIAMDHLVEIPDYYSRLSEMESEAESALKKAWGDTIEEATSVSKEARTYNRLVMFDFDGTLFRSWEVTPPWWEGTHLDTGPFSFFSRPESLDEPCVPGNPPPDFWVSESVAGAKKALSDPNTFTVLMTGRVGVHKKRVIELLSRKGLKFDSFYFNPGMAVSRFKATVLKNLVVQHPHVSRVEVWENENEGVYRGALEQAGTILGQPLEIVLHKIHVAPHALECGPQDFNLMFRVAAQTGDGTSVGLFIPLPEDLAGQFPKKEEDPSPAHTTFLYIGRVEKAREQALLDALEGAFEELGSVRAVLNGVDRFVNQKSKVVFSRIRFSRDLSQIRERVWRALEDAGFEVEDSFPRYNPHTTLEYFSDHHDVWEGVPPVGAWDFNSIELWGLSKKHVIPFGEAKALPVPAPPEIGSRRMARIMAKRASAAMLRHRWGT